MYVQTIRRKELPPSLSETVKLTTYSTRKMETLVPDEQSPR